MAVFLRVSLVRKTIREPSFKQLAKRILSALGEEKSELSVRLIGDARMRRLNYEYRKRDRTTDVLAFPMRETTLLQGKNPKTALLGDVVISLPTAIRQARESGRSIDVELATLLIHGVLHLCGYDHERGPRDAARMSRREARVLQVVSPVPRIVSPSPQRRKRGR